MKSLTSVIFLFLVSVLTNAQEITGDWYGVLKVQGHELNLIFHISENGDDYIATMDSPDQNASGLPIATTTFENKKLRLEAPAIGGMQYEGILEDNTITGTFKQGGMEFPLNLSREKPEEAAKRNRPQEPERPFPYVEEEVSFENKTDAVTLAGTLTLPEGEGNFPAVVLISGSGAQNRDEEVAGHKPFLVISDYLTRHGIAVLRYDDRGVGESTGNFSGATSADFANDARAAVEFLRNRKEINHEELGLIGHSEGGMIAPMIAAEDKDIAFLVLLAGTGLRGDEVLLTQQELIFRTRDVSEENIEMIRGNNKKVFDILNSSSENLEGDLQNYFQERLETESNYPPGLDRERYIADNVEKLMDPWFRFFITYDPSEALKRVDAPVLAISGEKDLQVSAEENLSAIEKALKKGGNQRVTVKEYPGLNHLFQESTTGSPDEYGEIEQTFSPEVLEDMKNWILGITGERE